MAELLELHELHIHAELPTKVKQAALIVAAEVVDELSTTDNHANRVKWAVQVIGQPDRWGEITLRYLLGKNHEGTVANIAGVPKVDLLALIRTAVNTFANNL